MNRIKFWNLIYCLCIIAYIVPANIYAIEGKEIESITVLADYRLAVPLAKLSSLFSQRNNVSISNTFGLAEEQIKKIDDGEPADLFITNNNDILQQLKVKGLLDVYSISPLIALNKIRFTSAVVASENMTPARHFLAFLKSQEAQNIFKQNGLTIPSSQ